MSADNTWDRVERLFSAALALPETERESYVRTQCLGDAETLDAVLDLISAQRQMGSFLAAPIVDFGQQAYGSYRALRELGRGGMSVVYLGERIDGGFEKKVAIKVVLVPVQAASERGETQILASLEHPNIARLLDAGVTASGFRYLVMEYVEGVPCSEYCRGLREEARLRLFRQICAGVQFLNRSLVVHRDLKPGNILVTADGVVKLLDFGIAKVLSPEAGANQTSGARAYTPDYASPEQILGQPVTTATDVYSLGVLLCELAGGKLPRTFDGMTMAEIVAQAQHSEAAQVPLTGDLALIAGKALRRDPRERYESASELARDIERYLEGRPVEARAPSWRYRAGRFLSRHRYAAAAAAAAALALTGATGIALWQARLAGQRFDQVRRLAKSVMFELHDAVRPLPGSLAARQLIVDRSLAYLDSLAADAAASEDVQLDVARGYLRMADILGTAGNASLGQSGAALARTEQALAVVRRILAKRDSLAAQRLLAQTLDHMASAYTLRGNAERAIPYAREGAAAAERVAAAQPASLEAQADRGDALHRLADALGHSKPHAQESNAVWRRALAVREKLAQSGKDIDLRQASRGHSFFASQLYIQQEYDEADRHARAAYGIDKRRLDGGNRAARVNLASDLSLLAAMAGRAKRHDEGIRLYLEQLRLRREIAAEDPKDATAALRVAATLGRLGYVHGLAGKSAEGIRYGEEALELTGKLYQADLANATATRELFFARADLANTYRAAKRPDRVCALIRGAAQLLDGPLKAAPIEREPVHRVRTMLKECAR